jgi:hypothetical protein
MNLDDTIPPDPDELKQSKDSAWSIIGLTFLVGLIAVGGTLAFFLILAASTSRP